MFFRLPTLCPLNRITENSQVTVGHNYFHRTEGRKRSAGRMFVSPILQESREVIYTLSRQKV
jgi:hypothetical protein